jgi:nucleoside-diphosphate-sugar epimerase
MAAAALTIRSCVIAPSLIYGDGTGLSQQSIQIPFLVNNALDTGTLQIVGKGLNTWSHVYIQDLVDLYLLALEKSKPGALYFAESGEVSFIDLAGAIAKRLDLKAIEQLDPEVAVEKWGAARALFTFGSNSRVRGICARRDLDWKPKHNSVQQWVLSDMQPHQLNEKKKGRV